MIGSASDRSRSEKVLVIGLGSGTKRVMKLIHETSGSTVDTLFITTDEEDIQIISDIHKRTVLNFKSELAFTKLTHDPIEEVADAINRI